MKLTARTKSSMIKQITAIYIEQHNLGNDYIADRLHELTEDILFDNYLTEQNIKYRFNKIVS
jgi:hypothetical protein